MFSIYCNSRILAEFKKKKNLLCSSWTSNFFGKVYKTVWSAVFGWRGPVNYDS